MSDLVDTVQHEARLDEDNSGYNGSLRQENLMIFMTGHPGIYVFSCLSLTSSLGVC